MERTFVLYATDGQLTSNNVDDIAERVFTQFGKYFARRFSEKWENQYTFKYYDDWSKHFHRALQHDALGAFFARRGTLGAYSSVDVLPDGSVDCSKLILEIRQALGIDSPDKST